MLKIYHDFYGGQATIRIAKSGACRLTVRTGSGKLTYAKNYKTERGARIAMGRLSDGWYPVEVIPNRSVCPA